MNESHQGTPPAIARTARGYFAAGVSGNPQGRPPLPREMKEVLESAAPRAIARLIELIESDDERVAAACANSVLDRLYGKPTQVTDAKVETTSIQAAHLRVLQEIQARREERLAAATGGAPAATVISDE
jgi:hypothetical protein